jgi:hypothetical protein
MRRARFTNPDHGDDDGHHPDGQVDEEDPSPRQPGGQRSAEQRPDSHGQAGDGSPDAEGDAAILAAERFSQQRQRHGEHDRPADALQSAGQLEHESSSGHAAEQRRAAKDEQADDVEKAAAVHVGETAGRQQERGQAERVGVDHPLQAREA